MASIAVAIYLIISPENIFYYWILVGIASVLGILLVIPIGGADMPVVISLLNSFTGIAAAMAGFIYNNQAMILGGILVGAAGMILTVLILMVAASLPAFTSTNGMMAAGGLKSMDTAPWIEQI